MPFPKLSRLIRQKPEALSLRERAADLQDRLARSTRPAPGAAATAAKLSPTLMRQEDLAADAELLRLGREFEAAAAREVEACAAINAAAAKAKRHEPAFPACLTLTAADHELNVYQHWTHPEALEGITLGGADVDWLRRRMPMRHEVLRPIREGERAHIDHPGRKFDIVPHPEAQARAEEIVAAYDAWRTELRRVHDEYVPPALETAADAAGEIAAAIASEIAALPARTAAGFRVKLRALLHYERDALTAELPELPDPDQILGHSIRQDALRDESGAACEAPGGSTPAGQPDPIFALINKHATSRTDLTRTANEADEPWRIEHGLDMSAGAIAVAAATYDTADAAEGAAWSALFATRPTTPAGLVALIRHLQIWAPENAGLGGDPGLGDIFSLIASDAERLIPAWSGAVDWQDPPPGFMASPAIEPTGFARIPDALEIDLNRLLVIAMAEFYRRTENLREHMGEREALAREAEIRAELFLSPLTAAVDPDSAGGLALAALDRVVEPDPIFALIEVSRRAEAEMQAFQQEARCSIVASQIAREDALEAAQIAASKAVWATVPTTRAGRRALVEYARFQAKLYYGADWQAKVRSDGAAGDIAFALMAAIEAERREAPAAPDEGRSDLSPDRAWAVAQAAAVDLSGLTVLQLCNLFDHFVGAADRWSEIMHMPWARNDNTSGFLDLNAAGDLASREHERAAEIRTRIAGEIERRATADHWERDQRLEVLIRYELLCNGNLQHAPELRSEMARAWGA